MTPRTLSTYIIGAVIVWVGLIISAAVMLAGTDQLAQILIVLGAGAFFFIILIPGWLRTLIDPDA